MTFCISMRIKSLSYALLIIIVAIVQNGCVGIGVVRRAEGLKLENGKVVDTGKPQPMYWAVWPLTVPVDIATLPFQLPYLYRLQNTNGAPVWPEISISH
jgi:hypothetical protein